MILQFCTFEFSKWEQVMSNVKSTFLACHCLLNVSLERTIDIWRNRLLIGPACLSLPTVLGSFVTNCHKTRFSAVCGLVYWFAPICSAMVVCSGWPPNYGQWEVLDVYGKDFVVVNGAFTQSVLRGVIRRRLGYVINKKYFFIKKRPFYAA